MKVILIILAVCLVGYIGSIVHEYFYERHIYRELKFINRYLFLLEKDNVFIRHKGKAFIINVDYFINDPVYRYKLYINDELVLTAYALNHGAYDSRQLEYNHKRSELEINKLSHLAFKKLKRMYYDKYLKVDYNYTSFYED